MNTHIYIYLYIYIYHRGLISRAQDRGTTNPPGSGQIKKWFLNATNFGGPFGESSRGSEEGFGLPFGRFVGPFSGSSSLGL